MDFFDVIERRQSIRAYAAKEIEQAKVDRILTALCLAPSAGNLQAFLVVLVREQQRRKRLDEAAYGRGFLAAAPIVLAFLADQHRGEAKMARAALHCFASKTRALPPPTRSWLLLLWVSHPAGWAPSTKHASARYSASRPICDRWR